MLKSPIGNKESQATMQRQSLIGMTERILEYSCAVMIVFYPFYAYFDHYFVLEGMIYTPILMMVCFLLVFLRALQSKLSFIGMFDYLILMYALVTIFLPVVSYRGDFKEIAYVYLGQNVLFFLIYLAVSRTHFLKLLAVLQKSRIIVIVFALVVVIVTVYYLNPLPYFEDLRPGGGMVLMIADLIALYIIVEFSVYKGRVSYRLLVLFFLLMYYNSLASILSVLAALSAYWIVKFRLTVKKGLSLSLSLLVVGMVVLCLVVSLSSPYGNKEFKDGIIISPLRRFVTVLIDPSQDESYVGRAYFNQLGIETISSNPLIGEYLYQYRKYGYRYGNLTGGYMHNILSVFAEYGLISFVLLVASLVLFSFHAINLQLKNSIHFQSFSATIYFVLVNFGLFRAYSWYWLPFLLGMCASFYRYVWRKENETGVSKQI